MSKKIIILILSLFIQTNIYALTYSGCDYSYISKLKKITNNINVSYDYRMENNYSYFDVTINNITPDMYFVDTQDYKTYHYSDTNNGEITIKNYTGNSGSYKFYTSKTECNNVLLGTKYYKFPTYNQYHNHKLCEDIPNYILCKKWVEINLTESEFEDKILRYKDSLIEDEENIEDKIEYKESNFNKFIDFYINYYYYIFIVIILVCSIIIVIKRKKDSFKL